MSIGRMGCNQRDIASPPLGLDLASGQNQTSETGSFPMSAGSLRQALAEFKFRARKAEEERLRLLDVLQEKDTEIQERDVQLKALQVRQDYLKAQLQEVINDKRCDEREPDHGIGAVHEQDIKFSDSVSISSIGQQSAEEPLSSDTEETYDFDAYASQERRLRVKLDLELHQKYKSDVDMFTKIIDEKDSRVKELELQAKDMETQCSLLCQEMEQLRQKYEVHELISSSSVPTLVTSTQGRLAAADLDAALASIIEVLESASTPHTSPVGASVGTSVVASLSIESRTPSPLHLNLPLLRFSGTGCASAHSSSGESRSNGCGNMPVILPPAEPPNRNYCNPNKHYKNQQQQQQPIQEHGLCDQSTYSHPHATSLNSSPSAADAVPSNVHHVDCSSERHDDDISSVSDGTCFTTSTSEAFSVSKTARALKFRHGRTPSPRVYDFEAIDKKRGLSCDDNNDNTSDINCSAILINGTQRNCTAVATGTVPFSEINFIENCRKGVKVLGSAVNLVASLQAATTEKAVADIDKDRGEESNLTASFVTAKEFEVEATNNRVSVVQRDHIANDQMSSAAEITPRVNLPSKNLCMQGLDNKVLPSDIDFFGIKYSKDTQNSHSNCARFQTLTYPTPRVVDSKRPLREISVNINVSPLGNTSQVTKMQYDYKASTHPPLPIDSLSTKQSDCKENDKISFVSPIVFSSPTDSRVRDAAARDASYGKLAEQSQTLESRTPRRASTPKRATRPKLPSDSEQKYLLDCSNSEDRTPDWSILNETVMSVQEENSILLAQLQSLQGEKANFQRTLVSVFEHSEFVEKSIAGTYVSCHIHLSERLRKVLILS